MTSKSKHSVIGICVNYYNYFQDFRSFTTEKKRKNLGLKSFADYLTELGVSTIYLNGSVFSVLSVEHRDNGNYVKLYKEYLEEKNKISMSEREKFGVNKFLLDRNMDYRIKYSLYKVGILFRVKKILGEKSNSSPDISLPEDINHVPENIKFLEVDKLEENKKNEPILRDACFEISLPDMRIIFSKEISNDKFLKIINFTKEF